MKKLYKNGKVHPSPPPPTPTSGGDLHHLLALQLPATILTLAAALSPEDKQVLAYLISCSCGSTTASRHKTGSDGGGDHPPVFECNCFRCYMSFWARWDASTNRQLIHEIIEVYEEQQVVFEDNKKSTVTSPKKKKKKRGKRAFDESRNGKKDELAELGSVEALSSDDQLEVGGGDHGDQVQVVEEPEKGSVKKIVSFLGEKINFFNFFSS
ncbi:hypothetical protein Ddye_016343 [Dipteronia dyeriana]|uniref:Uncharacterized protein n=1 Tax=Dipteronia dyeriana TaxID=168575 RepID=A0AAD9WYR5_9ROSI|nr:hypothetical protein Ddye_016343 [Dipteronia dyeriana]